MRAKIHDVFAHNESSALCLRVDLRQFFVAVTTEGRKVIPLDHVKPFWIGFAHSTSQLSS